VPAVGGVPNYTQSRLIRPTFISGLAR
jgi:hypothetical protein